VARNTFTTCVFSFTLLCLYAECGLSQSLSVVLQDTTTTQNKAPGFITGAFLVSNTDSTEQRLVEEIQIPDGWRLIIEAGSFDLEPLEDEVRLVAVAIPKGALPGDYTINYRVHNPESLNSVREATLRISVIPTTTVDMSVVSAPKVVEAGTNYAVKFQAVHTGNEAALIDLVVRSSAGYKVKLDSAEVSLEPGQTIEITAVVATVANVVVQKSDRLILSATVRGDSLAKEAKVYSVVEVIPAPAKSTAQYHRLPSHLTTRYVGDDKQGGTQVELAGSGILDDEGRVRLDYLYRGPSTFENNVFGYRDEFTLKVETDNVFVTAGDHVVSLSRLLERGRLGRGLSGNVTRGALEAGAIGFQSRPQYLKYDGYGGFVSATLNSSAKARANFFSKNTERTTSDLMSFATVVTPVRGWKADAEFAVGSKDSSSANLPQALFGKIDGTINGVKLSLQKYYANREFAGSIQDLDQSLVDIFAPLPMNFGYTIAYQRYAQNLKKDESFSSAPREEQIRTGIIYRNPVLLTGSVDIESYRRVDGLAEPDFDNHRLFVITRLQRSFRRASVNTVITRGIGKDRLTDSSPEFENYRLGVDLRLNNRQKFGAWFQLGHAGYSINARRNRIIGFNTEHSVIRNMLFRASLQATDRDDSGNFESTQFDVSWQYMPAKGHVIAIKLRQLDLGDLGIEGTSSYLLSYQIPLAVPLRRKNYLGSIQGRLYDADDSGSAGIPGALLRMGERTTLTDATGKYVFRSVQPGYRHLQVDNAAIGLNRVTLQRMPLEIVVRGGKTESTDIAVVKSCTIAGVVKVYGHTTKSTKRGLLLEGDRLDSLNTDASAIVPSHEIANCPLKLVNGDEVVFATTDKQGHFEVSKLRPGHWSVSVPSYALPDFHRLEHDFLECELEPGQTETINVRVIPRTRRLVIKESGTLRLAELSTEKLAKLPALEQPKPRFPSAPKPVKKELTQASALPLDDGVWFVQVGAFREQANSDRMAAMLKSAGYTINFVPLALAEGTIIQVRVGAFSSEQIANEVAITLRDEMNLPTLVITSRKPTQNESQLLDNNKASLAKREIELSVIAQSTATGKWFVQVGAFRNPQNAKRMIEFLDRLNLVYKLVPKSSDSNSLTQVRVGGFLTKSDVKKMSVVLDSILNTQTLIILDPN